MKATNYRTVEVYRFEAQDGIPNHPKLPVLIYGGVFDPTNKMCDVLERTFLENQWVGFHQRRVHETYHFHVKAHEVLGVIEGFATVQLGGPRGKKVELELGDLIVLPVGTGLRWIIGSPDFQAVSAYPQGQTDDDLFDTTQLPVETAARLAESIPLPRTDPYFGREGPLFDFWYEWIPNFSNKNDNPQPKDTAMKLNEVMSRNPEYVALDANLVEIARRMRDLDVGVMPVGDGVKLSGMVTDRDITIRATAEALDPKQTRASDIMTEDVLYAYEDEEVGEAIQTMKDKQVRRLIILNRDKDMVGVVALADIANGAEDSEAKAEAVQAVSKD